MRDAVLQEFGGGDGESFFLVKADGVGLGLQVKALGVQGFQGVLDTFVKDLSAQAGAAGGGRCNHPSHLDGAGFILLGIQAQIGQHVPLIVPVEQVDGIVILPVGLG